MSARDLKLGCLFCLVLVVVFFGGTLLTHNSYFLGDVTYYWWPRKTFIAAQLQSGAFPLWDPTFRCGIPFFAIPDNGVLDVFSLAFAFFDFASGLKFFHALNFFAAALACWLIGKKWRHSNGASLLLSLLIVFGGYFIVRSQFLSQCATLTWGIYAALLLSSQFMVLGALPLALMTLAGHWQTSVIILMFCLPILLIRFRHQPQKAFKFLVMASVFALGLGAVQILPALELSSLSYWGGHGLDPALASVYSLPLRDLINLIRIIPAESYWNLDNSFWVGSIHIGLAALVLAAMGFVRLSFRAKMAAALFLSASVTLSVMPLSLPYLRYPSRWFLGAACLLPLLAAGGFEAVPRKIKPLIWTLCGLSLAGNWIVRMPTINQGYFRETNDFARTMQSGAMEWTKSAETPVPPPAARRYMFSFSAERMLAGGGTDGAARAKDLRDRLYIRTPLVYRLSQAGGFGEPLVPLRMDIALERMKELGNPEAARPLLSRMGASLLLAAQPWESKAFPLLGSSKWIHYSNPDALPRAYWISGASYNATQSWDKPRAGVSAVCDLYQNERISIEGTAPETNGRVVLSDTFYPGWNAWLNGKRAEIDEDAEIFRSVQVPETGIFRIDFLYRPFSFISGLLITVLTSMIGFILGFIYLRRKARV